MIMIRMKRFIGSGTDGWDASECECDTWYPVTMKTRMTKIHFRIGRLISGVCQVELKTSLPGKTLQKIILILPLFIITHGAFIAFLPRHARTFFFTDMSNSSTKRKMSARNTTGRSTFVFVLFLFF